MLKKYQSSALLLRTHLLHLQRCRSNALFVWVDTVAALSPSLSLCFLLCLLNATYYFPTRRTGGNSDVKQPAYLLTVRGVCSFWRLCVCLRRFLCYLSLMHENIQFHKFRWRCVFMCVKYVLCTVGVPVLWYKGALSGSAAWIRLQGSWTFDSSSKNKQKFSTLEKSNAMKMATMAMMGTDPCWVSKLCCVWPGRKMAKG